MKTLFVTATAQTEANYYLIFHLFKNHNTDIKKIVIVSTDFSREKGHVDKLVGVLNGILDTPNNAVTVEQLHLAAGIEEYDIEAIKDTILGWIAVNRPSQIIFNITGGTKLISIAQDQIAQSSSRYECVYQNRGRNEIVWYNRPVGQQCYPLNLPENIENRLQAHGFTTTSNISFLALPASHFHYIIKMQQYMQADIIKTQSLVRLLNALTADLLQQSEDSFPKTINIKESNVYKNCKTWLNQLAKIPNSYFTHDTAANTLTFENKAAVAFVSGTWFEVLTGLWINQHYQNRSQEDSGVDVKIGLKFKKSSDGNEIDVAYIKSSYLHLMECKTVNWHKQESPTNAVNRELHKLQSISDVGGLNTHKYFVSLFDISAESLRVAKDKNITVIHGKQLRDFAEYIN